MTNFLTARELLSKARTHGLRIGKNTLRKLRKQKEITTTEINGWIYYDEDSFEAYVKRRTIPAKRQFLGSRVSHQGIPSLGTNPNQGG